MILIYANVWFLDFNSKDQNGRPCIIIENELNCDFSGYSSLSSQSSSINWLQIWYIWKVHLLDKSQNFSHSLCTDVYQKTYLWNNNYTRRGQLRKVGWFVLLIFSSYESDTTWNPIGTIIRCRNNTGNMPSVHPLSVDITHDILAGSILLIFTCSNSQIKHRIFSANLSASLRHYAWQVDRNNIVVYLLLPSSLLWAAPIINCPYFHSSWLH